MASLNDYSMSEDLAGFADGTLVSNDISVYIVNADRLSPIDNPETFESNGYNWEDVLPIGSDELSLYEKGKIFNIKSPHPNGTIFETTEDSSHYIIRDSQKHPLSSKKIVDSWLKKNPIKVSQKSLEAKVSCNAQKKSSQSSTYECEIPLEIFSNFSGFNYQLSLISNKNLKIDYIYTDYRKNIDLENLKDFIKLMISRIKLNHA